MATETFKLPAPVKIGAAPKPGEEDTRLTYSFADMVRHFQRKATVYNSTMDGARQGQRTLAAIENPDAEGKVTLQRADCRVLKQLVEAPRCGWVDARAKQTIVIPPEKPGDKAKTQTLMRRLDVSAVTFVTFADAIPVVPDSDD